MLKTTERITQVRNQIDKLHIDLSMAHARAQTFVHHGQQYAQRLDSHYTSLLAKNQDALLDLLAKCPPPSGAAWNSDLWSWWNARMSSEEPLIRVGEMREPETPQFAVPDYAPFIGAHKTIIIHSGGPSATQGLSLLQSLVVRTACLLLREARYTLLDPAGGGIAFPMRRHLLQVEENSSDLRRDLGHIVREIQRIIETYLDASYTSFECIPHDVRANERFHCIFAANFPQGYDRRAIEALQMIGNTGTRAGVYLFIHHNMDHELPPDMSMDGFMHAAYVDLMNPIIAQGLQFEPDSAPSAQVQSKLFATLHMAKPPERLVDWGSIVGIAENEWWRETSSECIETSIGLRGGGESLTVWFGARNDQLCTHGMLGAIAASDRSNLYHTLICGLTVRYSVTDLHLYLINGKASTAFEPYCHLPHAKIVSLRSPAELSRNILAELVAEKDRRIALFQQVGAADFVAYRQKKRSVGKLPRILLVVDEYQELFEGDREDIASGYLLQLAQQGHRVGIHMLLGSSRYDARGMLYQTAIFGNVHLRMAMQMADADIQALSEFGRSGRALIAGCDVPGKIVLNSGSGDDRGNQVGKVASLPEDRRERLVQKLTAKASTLPKMYVPQTLVFDGQTQPHLLENAQFTALLDPQTWPTVEYMEAYARKSELEGGLGIANWYTAEHPRVIWLGQEFTVHGQAKAILRRRTAENMLIVGGAHAPRYGMLAATLASLSVSGQPANTQVIIIDRCIPATPWSDTLKTVYDNILYPTGFSSYFSHNSAVVDPLLDDLLLELTQRQRLSEKILTHLASIFVMITEPDRVELLRRKADAYGLTDSPAGEKLGRLLVEGPPVGIHMILSFTDMCSLAHVLDDHTSFVHFRHRVALQMSEDESFTFVHSRKASQLQVDGPIPICALYLSTENNTAVRFKPYSIDTHTAELQSTFMEHIQQIGKRLLQRNRLS